MDLGHLAPHARHSGRQHPRLPRLYLRHPDPPAAVRGAPMIANTFAVFFTALVQLLLLLPVAPLGEPETVSWLVKALPVVVVPVVGVPWVMVVRVVLVTVKEKVQVPVSPEV